MGKGLQSKLNLNVVVFLFLLLIFLQKSGIDKDRRLVFFLLLLAIAQQCQWQSQTLSHYEPCPATGFVSQHMIKTNAIQTLAYCLGKSMLSVTDSQD